MKKILLICCLFIGLTSATFAQTHLTGANAEEKAKGLQKELKLTDGQTTKIAAIYKESAEKFDKIKEKEHGNTNKMTEAVRPLRTATVKKIKGVLTPHQAAKYDKLINDPKSKGSGWSDGWSSSDEAK
jgi:protein CpxP